MSHHLRRLRPLALALVLGASAFPVASAFAADDAACIRIDPDRRVRFEGRELLDSPGLVSADLRRLNARLARGECADAAMAEVAEAIIATPDDIGLAFLEARVDALAGRRAVAERRVDALLERDPALQPALVLKARLLLDREQRDSARPLLARAVAAQPEDLRAAFVQMRLQSLDAPKGDGPGRLLKALRDPALPPDLREDAQTTLLSLTALDLDRKEEAMREGLRFESQTPRWHKATALARLLAEESGKVAEARSLAQSVVDDAAAPHEARHEAAIVVAETWLMEAAGIDPAPSPRNARQVAAAKAVMEGDMVPVAGRIRRFHDLSRLLPFVADVEDPEARGPDGLTLLCRGAQLLEESKIRRALDAGAKVDGDCSGSTALAYVVRQGPGLWEMKTGVVRMLLDAGADPDPKLYPGSTYTAMSFCAEGLPGCEIHLLPMLEEAAAARAAAKP